MIDTGNAKVKSFENPKGKIEISQTYEKGADYVGKVLASEASRTKHKARAEEAAASIQEFMKIVSNGFEKRKEEAIWNYHFKLI